jgi:hypothetical protein
MTRHHGILPEGIFGRMWESAKHASRDREFWKTIFAVVAIGAMCFAAAAAYDRSSGGPEARQASIDAKAVLDGFSALQERSECVTTYTNADNIAQANLLLAFGVAIEHAALGQEITPEVVNTVHEVRTERRRYLILRSEVIERCDLNRPGGVDPLTADEYPRIFTERDLLDG